MNHSGIKLTQFFLHLKAEKLVVQHMLVPQNCFHRSSRSRCLFLMHYYYNILAAQQEHEVKTLRE
jgi:hypothetical protein